MRKCPYPPCQGTIDETGYCDGCGRQPAAANVEAAPPLPDTPRPTDTGVPVAGLVRLPRHTFPDPSSRVKDERSLSRGTGGSCANCQEPVGKAYGDQPALLTGFCPRCRTPYSFKPHLERGDVVADQYEVIGPLERGGFGWVYLAKDQHLGGNYVALKGLINNSRKDVAIAIAERNFLRSIDHPNIVRIFDFARHGTDELGEQTGYIVMEYLNGKTLETIVSEAAARRAAMPLEHILGYGHVILAALDYLHGRGLQYTDMKPPNVMCTEDRVKLIDAGGVRRLGDRDSPLAVTDGFCDRAEADHRDMSVGTDLYALGMTLQFLFARSGPRHDDEVGPAVESFRRLVNRAILDAAQRDGRFRSAADMSEQLTGVLREVLALRQHQEHPERSTLFAPTPVLLDVGLGAAPPLADWTAADIVSVPGRPDPRQVATGLPVPLAHPDDPNAELLATMTAPDPDSLLRQTAAIEPDSVEVQLIRCRAHLELSELDRAGACLDRAEELAGAAAGGHHWQTAWYRALLALAGRKLDEARGAFDTVYDALPGEVAPKLALGLCAELAGQAEEAERYYRVVWHRDRAYASAAFGLARIHLARGERDRARAILDEVPRVSPHFRAARTAAIRAGISDLDASSGAAPTAADLTDAVSRLSRGEDGGSPGTGEAGERLTAAVRGAVLAWFLAGTNELLAGNAVLGDPVTEHGLRSRLEESYRVLARQARSVDEHGALTDLANTVRPITLW
ncbi:tetratricopeptide repeat protein [Micromonospora sp. SL1-18]|uniref:tetratricopeptide repeat protein n=1 Tax=Micromonospora sp. SL1-18 TaxID=3399128 RepID=UPI003A4D45CA